LSEAPPTPESPGKGERTVPRVLVLLATFNGARHIEEQLRSLAAQRDVRIQVLMSDDGSNDRTVALSRQAAARYALALQVLPSTVGTGSAAKNFFRLFRHADFDDCDFVALCDQDDVWLEQKMARACAELTRTGADAYSSNSVAFWPDGKEREIRKDFPQRKLDFLFEGASQGCTYVLKTSTARLFTAWLDAHPQQTSRIDFHDWLIYAWARSSGLRWHLDGARTLRYRQSGANVIGANSGWAAVRRRVSQMRAGWLRQQAVLTAECIGMGEHPIVARLRRFGARDRLFLAASTLQFRRRPRDQLVLLLAFLTWGV
jgi:rhamnosyltransferase